MKTLFRPKDLHLLLALVAYSLLFYRQSPGLNFLLFTVLLVGILYSQTSTDKRRQANWYIAAGASIGTGISITLTGSELAVYLNVASLVLLAAFSLSPRSSVFVAAANGLYSVLTAFATTLRKTLSNEAQGGIILAGVQRQHVYMVGIPVAVSAVFLVIYASASSTFSYLLSQIRPDLFSWGWFGFTLLGFILLFGMLHQSILPGITEKDLDAGNTLRRIKLGKIRAFKLPALRYEYKTSTVLLTLLNLLLLFFILSDAYYLTIGTLPATVAYADYLHQGVYGLILSILLAMGVLLFVFRGNLNFYSGNRTLKLLAYTWLSLNVLLVLLTLSKNSIYVYAYGLTYKRIGVYTYLLLTAIGLYFSYSKVAHRKNNWFLFRKNAWALYLVLLLLSTFNWDRAITAFNTEVAKTTDYAYLSRLSDVNLPVLIEASAAKPLLFSEPQKQSLQYRKKHFIGQGKRRGWVSWSYNDWRVRQQLEALE